jgi:hypothetical protein
MRKTKGCSHPCACAAPDVADLHPAPLRMCWHKTGHAGAHECDDCHRRLLAPEPAKKIGRPRMGNVPRVPLSPWVDEATKAFFDENKGIRPGEVLDVFVRDYLRRG